MSAAGAGRRERLRDLALLASLALVVVGAGLGLRDPWPADEPRFALIARDMLANGNWFVPTAGGDYYADKPPVFFWAIALALAATGSLQVAFLLPALVSALVSIALVHDLARRLWSREVALAAGLLLLFTVQFTIQVRAAQIDGFLLLFTTLGVYGIARHLLLGPDWRWYAAGGFAAGLGVITKGVGFLPLLLPLVALALARGGFAFPGRAAGGGWRWWLAPLAALAGIGLWLVPMLVQVAASGDPAAAAYRDEILFQQTVTRYANAWHHHAPFWYFLVEVIPPLWLPGTALLPWLVPRWRDAFRARDPRPWLFLGWALAVVLFFSLSSGKRGVYVLPAVPAFVLACAPFLPELWRRAGVQRLGFGLAALLAAGLGGAAYWLSAVRPERLAALGEAYGVTSVAPLWAYAAAVALLLAACRPRRGGVALLGALGLAFVVQGWWINPMIDDRRSARSFMAGVEARVPPGAEFGMAGWREQFLLQTHRTTTNFGHARWREGAQEAYDAAYWLAARPGRVLLVHEGQRAECFAAATADPVGRAGRVEWYLVTGPAAPECVARGTAAAARVYRPPAAYRTPGG